MEKISFVIPCFGSPNILSELTSRIIKQVERLNFEYEIILVDDRCPKDSFKKIKELAENNKKIKGIFLSKNFGQHYAIAAGLKIMTGDWAIVMDCDLQDLPEEIPKLLEFKNEYEVIAGLRSERRDSIFKKINSRIFYKVLGLLIGEKIDFRIGNFGVYSKRVIKYFNELNESFRFFPLHIASFGFKQKKVLIKHGERKEGKSSYNLKKLIKLALEVIIYHSNRPLKISILLGLMISFVSLFFGIFITFLKLFHKYNVEGWASIIVSIFFLSGIILFSIGMLGVYVGKIFDETKSRNIYIIDQTLNL